MKTLYVSDMDGTLLGADSKISSRTAEAISALSRKGAMVTVATARTAATVVPLLEHTLTRVPAVVMTGAALWDRDRDKYTEVQFLTGEAAELISEVCRGAGINPFVYVLKDECYLDVFHSGERLNAVEQSFYLDRSELALKRFHLHTPLPSASKTILWYAMGEKDSIFKVAAQLTAYPTLSVSCYPDIFDNSVGHLEIFVAGVSKAAAVTKLKAAVGADRLVVFGDNLNDLPMMGIADVAVAVGNALDEVKAAADLVIGPNTDDSVAKFIEEDFSKSAPDAVTLTR